MIINPLKVWVQNILPVVYDDSLSYLEIVSKINAKTNEIIDQTNENTHAIEGLAEVIAELGDIEELKALINEIESIIENLYTTDAPLMDGTASAGSAEHAARSDHVHPSDTSKANKDLGINNSSVDQYVKILAVDNSGKPTAFGSGTPSRSPVTNPNLLDNAVFAGGGQLPVNQRGQTTYTGTGYTVDRWKLLRSGNFEIATDGVNISATNTGNMWGQSVDNPEALLNRQVCMSFIMDGWLGTSTFVMPASIPTGSTTIGSTALGVKGVHAYLRAINGVLYFMFSASSAYTPGTSVKIAGAKFELGAEQTLAHNEGTEESPVWVLNEIPDYGEELAKCQRYFQIFRTQELRPTYRQDYRPVMTVNPQSGATDVDQPTLDTVTIDGTTYYTASTEV